MLPGEPQWGLPPTPFRAEKYKGQQENQCRKRLKSPVGLFSKPTQNSNCCPGCRGPPKLLVCLAQFTLSSPQAELLRKTLLIR